MIIINTTFHVEKSIESSFCQWVREEYVPSALSSGLLSSPVFSRIMIEVQEDCSSFAVSFKTRSIEDAVLWHDGAGADLRQTLHSRFGEKALFFSTYMDEMPL
ncbi:MAG: DUF4286 family protein [Duncaniella sp.]|uniref:DUF4286 family protein n=1 Tax=Duncaniella sp. TaxID=2518496 RepID=UPI0023BD900D|nr:DUF4286 family protein [Duncaniella sp.]MDE5989118.1 DUF4286 family protein [Duncaniella sp.]